MLPVPVLVGIIERCQRPCWCVSRELPLAGTRPDRGCPAGGRSHHRRL